MTYSIYTFNQQYFVHYTTFYGKSEKKHQESI